MTGTATKPAKLVTSSGNGSTLASFVSLLWTALRC